MEKGRIEFLIALLEPGGNSEPNGNVQMFLYVNSKWVFSKTIPLWGQASQSASKPAYSLVVYVPSEPKKYHFSQGEWFVRILTWFTLYSSGRGICGRGGGGWNRGKFGKGKMWENIEEGGGNLYR